MQINHLIQKLANTHNREFVQIIKCEVVSYNENDNTIVCSPITSTFGSNITVKLSISEGNNIELIPTIGSIVLIGYTDNDIIELLSVSDADKINISSNIDISFNGGEFGGLVKVKELTDKINSLENLVNNLLNTLKTTTIPLAPSGTYPFAPLYSSFTPLTNTNKSEIENENITHGE